MMGNKSLKLLQISVEVNSGSVGRIAEQIGIVAINNGWDSYITFARNHNQSKSNLIKIGNKIDLYWHGLMTRIFDTHCLHSTRATKKLVVQIKEIKPNIILLHHIHGYYLNMEVLFKYFSTIDIPIVWVFHDTWSITGHCGNYSDVVGCDRWKKECFKCPLKTFYPGSYVFDRSKKNFRQKKKLFTSINRLTIVPVSNWLATKVKESFFKDFDINVITNSIDIMAFSDTKSNVFRKKYGLINKFIMLGVSTAWSDMKGLQDYLQLSKLIDANSIIVLVGLTKKQIAELPDNIIGIERTESVKELAQIYSESDVVLSLSYEETFGLTIVEGLACGTPGVVYNRSASPELIDEKTGFIVEPQDYNEILRVLKTIKDNGRLYYSHNCRERAELLYDANKKFQSYVDLFNILINKNSHG